MDNPDFTGAPRLARAGRRRVMDRYHLGRNTRRLAQIYQRRLGGVA